MKVLIEEYNEQWNSVYQSLKQEILSADKIGIIKTIDHVGSTSVKGLGAKPVIDIEIGTDDEDSLDMLPSMFEKLGFNYIKHYEVQLPFRRFFTKEENGKRISNIHCVVYDNQFRTNDIVFRDYLRVNEKARDEYYRFKKELSGYEWETVNDYADAKSDFIKLKRFEAEKHLISVFENSEAECFYDLFESIPAEVKQKFNIKNRRYKKATLINAGDIKTFIFNKVIGAGLHNYISRKDIIFFKKYYENVDNFIIQVTPYPKPAELSEMLMETGFSENLVTDRLYLPLKEYNPENTENEFEIEEVSEKSADIFTGIMKLTFESSDNVKYILRSGVGRDKWYNILARDGDEYCGCASMFICDDTAWMVVSATLPEFRNKGIHEMLIMERIKFAISKGCRWIGVETNHINDVNQRNQPYHNLLKKGFIRLYSRKNFIYNNN